MSEWIRLTPEGQFSAKYYREDILEPVHELVYADYPPDSKAENADLYLSTQELASIPWVRALVETSRKAQEHLQQESDTGGSVGDAINAQKLHVALAPFKDVV